MANHKLDSNMLNFKTKTGSRNRVRIPVAGTRFTKTIKPGDRVEVGYDLITNSIRVQVNEKGNYKVEKDGAIRFPAHKFNLQPKNIFICSESIGKDVNLVNLESATF
jgi:hypothetical protein